jgi:tRNA threonylcarbamoyladenosine biosynthesis protein TsaE
MIVDFSLNEVGKVVKKYLLTQLNECRIFTFKGPLGVGKTTMIKEFLSQAGVTDIVTSPTFAYVKRYTTPDGERFNHFDLYRLGSLESFLELGFDEYLCDEASWTVIEWPEIIEKLLKNNALKGKVCVVELSYLDDDLEKRQIKLIK